MKARTSAVALVLVGISVALAGAQAQQPASPTPIQSGFGQGAYMAGGGASDPQLLKQVRPNYTMAALQAGIQGVVELEAVVLANGTVGDVRVVKSLDTQHGLDAEAMIAARKWLFRPGYVKGVAVPVLVTLILEFRPSQGEAPNPTRPPTPMVPAVRPGGRVIDPALLSEVKPVYTPEARRAGIQGFVELEAVVNPDGAIQQVRVTKSLDRVFGLDEAATAAATQWKFRPGTLDGQPVPVLVTLILEFRLRDNEATRLTQAPPDEFLKGVTRMGDAGAVAPKMVSQVRPNYTQEAMREKIQGVVEIEAVVMPDGSVARARVTKSLDTLHGLDGQALVAAKLSRFVPNSGTLNGTPVPCLVLITMEFRLH